MHTKKEEGPKSLTLANARRERETVGGLLGLVGLVLVVAHVSARALHTQRAPYCGGCGATVWVQHRAFTVPKKSSVSMVVAKFSSAAILG